VEAVGVLDDAATQLLIARGNGGPARQLIIRSVEGKKWERGRMIEGENERYADFPDEQKVRREGCRSIHRGKRKGAKNGACTRQRNGELF
jgi:hypothetical protein